MTTPTPEAIEAVVDAALDLYHWEAFQSQAGDIAEAVEDVIRKAVANARPIFAAQAKAEALEELAVKLENIASIASYTGSEESMETWLNAAQHAHDAAAATTNRANNLEGRANNLEGKSE